MSTSRLCPSCGAVLEAGDRYCPSCGRVADPVKSPATAVAPETLGAAGAAGAPGAAGTETITCSFCGHVNLRPAATCSTCGAKIGEAVKPNEPARAAQTPRQGIGLFQSWKFTLGIGAILVAVLIFFVSSKQIPETAKVQEDPHDAGMMQRIKELQAHIEENPRDPDALLEFANMLYDVKFFQRAAEMYERHLALNPANADARVDLGTSYFQMSFTDSLRGDELISLAESCFLKAIAVKPKHQLAHFNLGIIHLHRSDMNGANGWFRKSVEIDPNTEAAKRAQQLLSQHVQNNPT